MRGATFQGTELETALDLGDGAVMALYVAADTGADSWDGLGGLASEAASDEIGAIVAIVAVVLVALFASIYFVVIAPGFFAEVLVDAALSVGLYRRLGCTEGRHWLLCALERTFLPFVATAVVAVVAGVVMQSNAPDGCSIGDVLVRLAAE
jgi:hypothetical protein